MKMKEAVKKDIFEKISFLHEKGYYLIGNPLCRGYQSLDTLYMYYTIYRKKNVFVIELPSRFKDIYNRNRSNNYHCKLIFAKKD